jgi:hypothetical protein
MRYGIIHMPGDDWTRNATDPHAKYFVVKDFLLLLILKKHSRSSLTDYTLMENIGIFSLYLTIEVSVASTSSNAAVPAIVNNPRTAPDTPTPV